MSLVRLTDVVKSYDGVRAVDAVSFAVDRGEIVGFLGPNGAGKTTTMRLITQTLEAEAGTIEIDGRPVADDPLGSKRRIGYLPETNPLYSDMLVGEYLGYVGRLRGLEGVRAAERTHAVVEQTGIADVFNRPINQLSKGYRQRVGLAQAILPEPDILILDEPTEGLDPNQRVEIRNLITRLGADRTVILSTHVMQEVQLTCSRLLIINRGRIIADGDVEALLRGGGRGARVSVELEADPEEARTALELLDSVSRVRTADGGERARLEVIAEPGGDPRPDIFGVARERGWVLWEMHLEQESLEQFFRDLTESAR
ncbi:MAG: ATP-binding cassette domain-containing protein [Gemmatimonadota bacterium]